MDQLSPQQARQVWQRVRASDSQGNPLPRLLDLEAEISRAYHVLHNQPQLRQSSLLSRLREDSRRFSAILSGMCRLLEQDFTVHAPPSVRGNALGLLRLCCQSRQESIALLEKLPPELGASGKLLSEGMKRHCMILLELLGRLPEE